jgi:hypothetical protein
MTDESAAFQTGLQVRYAMSDHDASSPCTALELMTIASSIEEALVEGECQFSHPNWRFVDGLRALARVMA